jgi:hypothetical protein
MKIKIEILILIKDVYVRYLNKKYLKKSENCLWENKNILVILYYFEI